MANPLPATILTGFFGAGKTTLLRHILHTEHGEKIAVIENEFGAVPIDNSLLGDRATRITTLSNGCICCSSANELANALLDLLEGVDNGELQFSRLLIECTGMADPGPVIQTFFSHPVLSERFLLDGVITLVDAVHAEGQLNDYPLAQAQVGYADRILLTKTDIAPDSAALEARLQQINARAPLYRVTHGDIALEKLFDIEGFTLTGSLTLARPRFRPIVEPLNAIHSIVLTLQKPLALPVVSDIMERLLMTYADNLLRYKGILSIDGDARRLLFQGVQRLYNADWDREWRDDEPRVSILVFIGAGLPEPEIRAAFAAYE